MKRIAVLIFAVISMILFVSCDSPDGSKGNKIVVYTEPVTIAETVGIRLYHQPEYGKISLF